LLAQTSSLLLSPEKVTTHLLDEEIFDDGLCDYYRRALVEMDTVNKELKILRGMTAHTYLRHAEDLLSLKVTESVIVTEDSCCERCGQKLGLLPLLYEHSNRRLLH
jgi:hypothetical protein